MNAVIVAGSGRSGTTWVAELLAAMDGGKIVFEPFHAKVPIGNMFAHSYLRPGEQCEPLKRFWLVCLNGQMRHRWVRHIQQGENPTGPSVIVKAIRANLMLAWVRSVYPTVPVLYLIRDPRAVSPRGSAVAGIRNPHCWPCSNMGHWWAPTLADARVNLGLARLDAGRLGEAIHELEQAVALAPGAATPRLDLGTALRADGQLESALARFLEAAALDPTLGAAHRNAAVCHQLLGRTDHALACYRRALALDPQDADSLTNLGVALLRAGQVDEAVAVHAAAVAAAPLMAEAWLNRATALQAMGRLDEAKASVERSLALAETAAGRTALGSLEAERGRPEVGVLEHERALVLDPQHADAHWNLALALLASGALGRAWDQYEWRWRAANAPARWRDYPWPTWQGEPVQGKRILIWREQGLGDELMFLSVVPDLIAAGARVTVLVSERLRALVARSLPGATVRTDSPGAVSEADGFDCHLPMGSLPRWLRRARNAFPASGAYLQPDPLAAARWRERLAGLGSGPTVGVCWRSGLVTAERRRFYPSLRDWAPVFGTPGVTWVNLQYDDCLDELREIEGRWGVTVHRWDDVDLRNDLESVLALVASLSAVVTAPTVVSSFAGAVGTRTWQVDSGSDWTALGEPGSPWFPSIGVVRPAGSDRLWSEVLARVGSELGVWTREAAA